MRSKNDDGISDASPPVTAQSIIKDFVWQADMAYFEENLHELFIEFVCSESGCDRTDKDDIIYTYTTIRQLIKQIKLIENQIRPR